MEKWCDNELRVSGKTEDVRKFEKHAKGKPWVDSKETTLIDFNKFVPYPDKYRDMDIAAHKYENENPKDLSERPKGGFYSGGYDWCINNWGTKWNASQVELVNEMENKGKMELEYRFSTAWSPPEPIVRKMGEMFPTLSFDLRYFEGSMGFNGMLRVEQGNVVAQESGAYFGTRGG